MEKKLISRIRIDWEKISPDSYLHDIPAFHGVNEISFSSPVTFFAGENGSGKSTLLEAIAVAYGFNPEGGTRNYAFTTRDSHSELYQALTLIKERSRAQWGYFLRAETFYNLASAEEEYSRNARPSAQEHFHEISHGESFLNALTHNFSADSIYFLDEPEAALSPQRQLSLMAEIHDCVRGGSQFFIVTHSPILLGYPDAEIWNFDESPMRPVAYEETESYKITKLFLTHKELILRNLFEEDNE